MMLLIVIYHFLAVNSGEREKLEQARQAALGKKTGSEGATGSGTTGSGAIGATAGGEK